MSETAEHDKFTQGLAILALTVLFVGFVLNGAVFPYMALKKVEKGELKTACVYVAIEKKQKYHTFEIFMDGKFYKDKEIMLYTIELPLSYRQQWASFPINKKKWDFFWWWIWQIVSKFNILKFMTFLGLKSGMYMIILATSSTVHLDDVD